MVFCPSLPPSSAPPAGSGQSLGGPSTDASSAGEAGSDASSAADSSSDASSAADSGSDASHALAANAEPDAGPSADSSDLPAERAQAEVDALVRRFLSLPPIAIAPGPPPSDGVDRHATTIPPSKPPSIDDLRGFEQKLAELEPHLAETNWDSVLGVLEAHESLPPQLALLYAIALRERDAPGDADALAIQAVASLLSVPEDSHAALVLAKRLLRRNPVAWQKRRAPSARVSIVIAIVVAVLGAAIGFLMSPGVPLFD